MSIKWKFYVLGKRHHPLSIEILNGHAMHAQLELELALFFARNVIIGFKNIVLVLQLLWRKSFIMHIKSVKKKSLHRSNLIRILIQLVLKFLKVFLLLTITVIWLVESGECGGAITICITSAWKAFRLLLPILKHCNIETSHLIFPEILHNKKIE